MLHLQDIELKKLIKRTAMKKHRAKLIVSLNDTNHSSSKYPSLSLQILVINGCLQIQILA